jgi:hypothetical protein
MKLIWKEMENINMTDVANRRVCQICGNDRHSILTPGILVHPVIAELEIRHLHQKIDHLLSHQWERLVAIQEIQMELISEVRGRR